MNKSATESASFKKCTIFFFRAKKTTYSNENKTHL